jgi:muramidase (phage lysozyme)
VDAVIPAPALAILELIRVTETARADLTAYETVYGHNEAKLTKPLTQMTVEEVQHWQPGFTKSFGSSATGAYQFMYATLKELKTKLTLTGQEIFSPELQDELGFELLRRRGYTPWADGRTTTDTLMVGLAKEWASFPVPSRMRGAHRMVERGETYYAGDRLNKALIRPDTVWLACEAARTAKPTPPPEPIPPKPEQPQEPGPDAIVLTREEWQYAIKTIAGALSNPAVRDELLKAVNPHAEESPSEVT